MCVKNKQLNYIQRCSDESARASYCPHKEGEPDTALTEPFGCSSVRRRRTLKEPQENEWERFPFFSAAISIQESQEAVVFVVHTQRHGTHTETRYTHRDTVKYTGLH